MALYLFAAILLSGYINDLPSALNPHCAFKKENSTYFYGFRNSAQKESEPKHFYSILENTKYFCYCTNFILRAQVFMSVMAV